MQEPTPCSVENNMNNTEENNQSIAKRLWIYQSERFPLLGYALMTTAFTFSAISYSRLSRGEEGFIDFKLFIIGAITSFIFFFLLRLFDEFKDYEKDSIYQPYRPVPRGLVSLNEIKWIIIIIISIQITLNAIFMPVMLIAYASVMAYMFLMNKEFFCKNWLLQHPIIYMLSHMFIMPLIDFYTTGLDWLNYEVKPSKGLIVFLVITFLNGIVIEIGRKIRTKEDEENGVETYSNIFGTEKATIIWLIIIYCTCILSFIACYFAGFILEAAPFLTIFVIACSLPAIIFLKYKTSKAAKNIELASGIWTILMYLTLGGVPMMIKLII